jgi:hypothetical protein
VDQRFLDIEIEWGMITGDDKPLLHSGILHGYLDDRKWIYVERTMIPTMLSGHTASLGINDHPFSQIHCGILSIKDKLYIYLGVITVHGNRVHSVGTPEQDTDAATKGCVDNRTDAAVTYLQGVIGDALQTISNLQDQVNNLMNSAALETPSTTYFEFSFTSTYIQIYETSSIITLLFSNQNTVYTNLRLELKIIQGDGNLNKEVVHSSHKVSF